ncbi:MAG: hypothetical protein J6Y20_08865 [Lachnospiraceae bacterium]|nr:hypothetical protein [Lachnospiraceae bacterium]
MTNLELLRSMGPMNLAEFIFLTSCNVIKGARKIGDRNISSCTVSGWEEWLAQPAKYTDGTPPRHWKGV